MMDTKQILEDVFSGDLPIVTVQESGGMYFPVVCMGNREFTSAGFSSWRECNAVACEMADNLLQAEIDKVLGV